MLRWREVAVDDPAAHALLVEYFESRAAGFPAELGRYRTVFPAPHDFVAPKGVFVVADDEGVDVGCGGARRIHLDGDDRITFEVKHLWLQPQARGRGNGRALLQQVELQAAALGAERLVLDTNDSLAAAGGLYRSSGYRSIAPYNENPNATAWYEKSL